MAPSSGPRATRGAAARRTTRRLLVQQTRTRTAAGRTGEADGRSVPEAGVRTTRPQRDESRVSVRARSAPSSQLLLWTSSCGPSDPGSSKRSAPSLRSCWSPECPRHLRTDVPYPRRHPGAEAPGAPLLCGRNETASIEWAGSALDGALCQAAGVSIARAKAPAQVLLAVTRRRIRTGRRTVG
jgi:hypothetical protein